MLIFIEIKKLDPFFLFLKNLLKGKKSDTCIFTESELFVVVGLVWVFRSSLRYKLLFSGRLPQKMPLTDVLCLVANCCRCSSPRSCGLADNSGRVITQPVKGLLMQKSYKSLTFYLPNAELMPLLFYYLINFCVPGIW